MSNQSPQTPTAWRSLIAVIFGSIYASIALFFASRLQPLVYWKLRRSIAKNGASAHEVKRQKAWRDRAALGLLTLAPWTEMEIYLRQIDERTQLTYVQALVGLYLHHERTQEAKAVAQFYGALSQKWIDQNSKDALEALKLRRRLRIWYGRSAMEPRNILKGDKAMAALQKVSALDRGWLTRARDARLALGFIEWIEQQSVWPLNSHEKEKNPFKFLPLFCDHKLAQRLGMPDENFDRLWLEAIHLDIE